MAICATCGNDYWMAFDITTVSGDKYTFDSFECAIQKLAPTCEHCEARIIGHGAEVEGRFFCCAHCARKGESALGQEIRDSAGAHPQVPSAR
ncbi:phage terminase large subunit GpA-like protein [Nocardiopsis mwathae]|uniref:Phage terminase large subunit GpA-like protein n=1 Tax=Nocardiopsis mwathae TaxID=1472723 RepID=A0A7W9YGC7_9ACTN|nr:Prokaryotic metallothionein [Nocardiopsis mwathae]MBB6171653.1 phage terminase large subunit GpA-like protein [Nocardiopsis mwathae]